jgi:phenylacetate-CoA ligase
MMTLHCEVDHPSQADNAAAIQESIRDLTKLRGEVLFVARGSLPDDGKVIDDVRDYK